MTDTDKDLIRKSQISSLKRVLKEALDYHFSNFIVLEKLGNPYPLGQNNKTEDFIIQSKANTNIKFEVQAYLTQYRRLKHFIVFFQKQGRISKPIDSELRQSWIDLMDDNGVVNLLVNKWATHRSVDYPRKGDTDFMHLEVLLNLDGPVTMWTNDHLILSIDRYTFCLYDQHSKIKNFSDWVFKGIDDGKIK